MKQYGLIGFPLAHSFSPTYFNEKFRTENINARYDLFPLEHIEQFTELRANHVLSGLNVTIPYKEAIIPFLDQLSPEAKAIGAVNTIVFQNNALTGYNTDAPAFEQVLNENRIANGIKALVFGTGGSSKAVTYVLQKTGIPYTMVSRQRIKNYLDYESITEQIARDHLLWINTTPVGQSPNLDAHLALPYHLLSPEHFCIDLIYNPAETVFLSKAKHANALAVNGLSMLRYQAEKAWNLWQS